MTSIQLRDARPDDAEALLAIYAPFVEETAVTFEVGVPSPADFAARIEATSARWPWLVAETSGEAAAYAYASAHRTREAYRFSAEVSAYSAPAHRRRGLGRALYEAVLELLGEMGIVNAYAGIALPNDASVGFHEALGFSKLGVYRHVGFKLGAWHDVGWWEKTLAEPGPRPPEPVPASRLRGGARWRAILERHGG